MQDVLTNNWWVLACFAGPVLLVIFVMNYDVLRSRHVQMCRDHLGVQKRVFRHALRLGNVLFGQCISALKQTMSTTLVINPWCAVCTLFSGYTVRLKGSE
jgi:hypothetical protein